MSGFTNAIAGGGGNLIITSLQSPGFKHGIQGWQVAKDGSAEFNDLTIRGTFFGQDFILSPAGLFFYSGTPGPGTLVGSWASAAGADQFGNRYAQGICIGTASNTEIQVRPDLDAILIYES